MRGRVLELARALVRRSAHRVGLATVHAGIYTPVPVVPPADDDVWTHEQPFHVDTSKQIAFMESALAPYFAELPDAFRPLESYGFSIWNGWYEAGDAETLYAMLRHLRPRRVLELGSGFSTLVSAAACAANRREGAPAELVAVDPAPQAAVTENLDGLSRVELRDCRDLEIERFTALEAGDVLFIDTSHVVKLGGEVNWLVLEVLPVLARGVTVHFHDVFIPYEYPRSLFEQEGYFNEQYLLQAFLTGNDAWEVILALCALQRREPERLAALIPSVAEHRPGTQQRAIPAAFWIRRA